MYAISCRPALGGAPATSTRPLWTSINPAMRFSSVVLPQPDGPTTDTNSPEATLSDVRESAITAPPKTCSMSSTTMVASATAGPVRPLSRRSRRLRVDERVERDGLADLLGVDVEVDDALGRRTVDVHVVGGHDRLQPLAEDVVGVRLVPDLDQRLVNREERVEVLGIAHPALGILGCGDDRVDDLGALLDHRLGHGEGNGCPVHLEDGPGALVLGQVHDLDARLLHGAHDLDGLPGHDRVDLDRKSVVEEKSETL